MKQKTSSVITAAPSLKKERYKARIKAKVKLKLQKSVDKFYSQIFAVNEKVEILKSEINLFNPRMTPLQPHTKSKWSEDLNSIQLDLQILINKARKV